MAGFGIKSVALVLGSVGLMALGASAVSRAQTPAAASPTYTSDGKLEFPKDYRTWIYLSSGMDMSYVEGGQPDMSMFDNVFVNREAYAAFQKTGTWPDKTVMVLEARRGEQNGSINKHGRFQTDVMGAEIHVKDEARFKGGWAFFGFDGDKPGELFPQAAACYSCHREHAAVDTTFVQFYPTLLPIAKAHGTLSQAYLSDEAAAKTIPASAPRP